MTKHEIQDYRVEYGLEVVKLWRRAFQRAMGLEEQNRQEQLLDQLEFFARLDPATISVAVDVATTDILGMMVQNGKSLDHLYVHVDHQGHGLGSGFIRLAKERSPTGVELYTFQKNTGAQAFYCAHGFVEVERGFADKADNPWASSSDELADIRYRWTPS
jgi:GNAT superfamily N-acetyltransferase